MSGSKLTSLKSAAQSLVDILFGNETTPANLKIGLVPFFNVNIGTTNTAYVSNSTNPNPPDNWGTTSWGGCVLENVTSDNDTKDDFTGPWEVMYWEDDSNNNWISSGGSFQITSSRSPNLYCPSAAITPLTNNKTTLTTAISNLVANGGTHINLGAIWGWRVISPSEPFTPGTSAGIRPRYRASTAPDPTWAVRCSSPAAPFRTGVPLPHGTDGRRDGIL